MKKLFLLILLFTSLSCFAQVPLENFYIPGATWTLAYPWYFNPRSSCENYGFEKIIYRIERDSIASGITYHLLSVAKIGGYYNGTVPPFDPLCGGGININSIVDYKTFARIRIDSNRVFFTQEVPVNDFIYAINNPPFPLGHEYLLYDFNLTVGSIIPPDSLLTNSLYVNSIDSVILSNGLKVGKYNDTLSCSYNDYNSIIWGKKNWIWGIGSSVGFLPNLYYAIAEYGPGPYPTGDEMALCYENPFFSYKFRFLQSVMDDSFQYNCFDLSISQNPPIANSNVVSCIFPNPANSEITVNTPDSISTLMINNILEQSVYYTSSNYKFNGLTIDISILPRGLYFVYVNSSEIMKFIKY